MVEEQRLGGQQSRAGDSTGRARGPGSPTHAHSCMREGGATPGLTSLTFQLLPHPSSLFSPVPTISQVALELQPDIPSAGRGMQREEALLPHGRE